jgi:TatD DNase family protein
MLPLFDAHNHLQDAWLTPHRPRVFADLASVGVRQVVVNGTCESDWPDVAALARESPLVLPSYGLHPWDAGNRSPNWQQNLLSALGLTPAPKPPTTPPTDAVAKPAPLTEAPTKVGVSAEALANVDLPAVASAKLGPPTESRAKLGPPTVGLAKVGEFGLDRWILDRARPDDPRLAGLRRAPLAEQIEVFLWQLELAATHNLPASIHCLDAWGHLHDLLRTAKRPARGFLLHAYSGPAEMVSSFADLGAYFSFNGNFFAPKKTRLRELYSRLPADRLLVETDAPAMRLPAERETFPPLPTSDGSVANHPANLAVTYAALAELRQIGLERLAAQVETNFRQLFVAG